jgi:hypothetical protein
MLGADDPAFEAAAVRWIARFTSACDEVTVGEVQAALEALDALSSPESQVTLTAFAQAARHA